MPSQASPPDHLERLFTRLVANLAELDPSRLHRPFPVAELTESLVPYRTHRALLGFDSAEDYEMVVLRLLAGERGYARVEPEEVHDILAAEARAIHPDTALFRRYRDAMVRLDPGAVGAALGEFAATGEPAVPAIEQRAHPRPPGGPAGGNPDEPDEVEEGSEPPDPDDQLPFVLEDAADEEAARPEGRPRASSHAAPCSYCGGELPIGRAVLFCPHCGQNVGVVHCPTCDAELDVGWRFCITCGQKVTGLG